MSIFQQGKQLLYINISFLESSNVYYLFGFTFEFIRFDLKH